MVDRSKKPAALATTPGLAPQPQVNFADDNSRVIATLPTGESVEILLYGATIISWKDVLGNEKLWMSEAAKQDGPKGVRGGIPIVFPAFGKSSDHPPTSKLPQHGFARNSRWEYLGKTTSEATTMVNAEPGDTAVTIDFGLSPSNLDEETRQAWPYNFGLIYSVTLTRDELETSIVVRNEGQEPWDFQVLMHTYFRVKDVTNVKIYGFTNSVYIDKTKGGIRQMDSDGTITITGEIDRVYTPPGAPEEPIHIYEGDKKIFTIVRDNLYNAVVWNPWTEKAKSMADFEPKDGFMNMICVEAGQVAGQQSHWVKVEPGETYEGSQIIKAAL